MKSPRLGKTATTVPVLAPQTFFPPSLEMYLLQLILRSKSLEPKPLTHYIPLVLTDHSALLPFLFSPSHAAERSFLMGSFSEKLKQELRNEHPSTSANTKNTLRNPLLFLPKEPSLQAH